MSWNNKSITYHTKHDGALSNGATAAAESNEEHEGADADDGVADDVERVPRDGHGEPALDDGPRAVTRHEPYPRPQQHHSGQLHGKHEKSATRLQPWHNHDLGHTCKQPRRAYNTDLQWLSNAFRRYPDSWITIILSELDIIITGNCQLFWSKTIWVLRRINLKIFSTYTVSLSMVTTTRTSIAVSSTTDCSSTVEYLLSK